jgi:DNA-binding LacI/PurR family transcriptional regulator
MLARGRHQLIGVFTYEPQFPYENEDFYHPYLLGIEREASHEDYNLLLFTRHRSTGQRGIYRNGTNGLSLADGAILLGPYPDRDELQRLSDEGYPFVFIGRRQAPGCEVDWVTSDYAPSCAEATEHLLTLGHRRIAFAGWGAETESYGDRLAGCKMAAIRVPAAEILVIAESALNYPARLTEALRQINATAILLAGGLDVRGLLEQIPLTVPDELSVIFLGDMAASVPSSLAHLVLNRQTVGEEAVRLLVNRLNGTAAGPQQKRVPCQFVVGKSTAPPTGS